MSDFGDNSRNNFSDDDVIRLRAAFGRIFRLIDRQVSGDGLTRTQLSVLGTIGRRGPIGISELAECEGVNPTMLSRILGKLEDLGLVARTAGTTDKRAAQVAVTPVGRRMHDRLRKERAQLLRERLDRLADQDAAQLRLALPALEHLAEEMARDPEPAGVGSKGGRR